MTARAYEFPWATEWIICFTPLEFSKDLRHRCVCLHICGSGAFVARHVRFDLERKFRPWIAVDIIGRINKFEVGGKFLRDLDLRHKLVVRKNRFKNNDPQMDRKLEFRRRNVQRYHSSLE